MVSSMTLDPIAKIFLALGVLFLILGVAWQFGWLQALKLGQLPGDIRIERENMRVYFPITTMILASVVLSLIMWFFRQR